MLGADLGAGRRVRELYAGYRYDGVDPDRTFLKCRVCVETSSLEVGIRSARSATKSRRQPHQQAQPYAYPHHHRLRSSFLSNLGRTTPLAMTFPLGFVTKK